MNNQNNPTRVVIDLDGSLGELDDDDITLPSLPASPAPITSPVSPPAQTPTPTTQPSSIAQPKSESQPTTHTQPTEPRLTPEQTQTQTETSKAKKGGWFSRMKTGLTKSRKNLAEGMANILIGGKEIDDELLEEVEDQLLVADIGVDATNKIIKAGNV